MKKYIALLSFIFCMFQSSLVFTQQVEIKEPNSNQARILLDPLNAVNGGEIRLIDHSGTTTCILSGDHENGQGAYMNMYTGEGAHRIQLDAHHHGGGQLYLRNSNNHVAIHLQAQVGTGTSSSDAVIDLHDIQGNKRVHLGASDGLFGNTLMVTYQGDGDIGTALGTSIVGGGGFLNLFDGNGNAIFQATATPATNDYHLKIDGKIIAEELRIATSQNWPDYVFIPNYKLLDITELNKQITTIGHLPGIPSANEVELNGIDIGEMQRLQMEKIEELTLYIIQLNERILELESNK